MHAHYPEPPRRTQQVTEATLGASRAAFGQERLGVGTSTMANNTAHIDAGGDDVFALLLDASAYPAWVVGTRRLRGVDPEWPGPGACFHHAIGIGPFELRDSTRMLESDPPHRVVLEARFRPAGTARVTITVRPDGEGTEVELEEHPARGPVESIPGRVFDAATHLRNAIALRRLRRLAGRRPASEAART